MELRDCENTLYSVAAVKMPRIIRTGKPAEDNPDGEFIPLGGRAKIEQLESYLLLTAEARQEACEARLYVQGALKSLRRQFREITGWEARLNGAKLDKASEKAKDEARRAVNPDLYESIQSAEWLEKRLTEQISRLQHDDDVASRCYTLITGS